jgi:NO-binding membrane sensor protein with MHYT domain
MGRFLGFDVVTPTDIIKIFVTGTIAGFGVAGMHYIGQASITGMPYIAYRPQYIIGSVIIASGAVCIALYIMFIMLRPKLKHTLWSKLAVAVILAAAVCLMHFTGMRGTVYGWPREQAISRQSQLTGTNAAIVGVVTALAFGACVGCAIFFAVSSWSKQRERKRRRRVVIAAVFLDQYDRVLVSSTDGMLPMCDISSLTGDQQPGSKRSYSTSSTESSALGIDLTAGHDAFVSALKMSWSWRSGLLPNPTALTQEAVNGHLATSSLAADIRRGSQYTLGSSVLAQDSKPVRLSIAKFLEMFGNAAGQLAVRMTGQDTGIMRLGVLYDQILTT